jgi:UDP-2-acetamido-3-amino-2,3-dideoxy-glucuronate N-acetyltransferase
MTKSTIEGVMVDKLPVMRDPRGALTVVEFKNFISFPVARIFFIRDVPPGTTRGAHAHFRCKQYMICQNGRVRIVVADGANEKAIELSQGQGMLVEPGIFATETYLDADSELLVLCDRPYEKDDYIHDINEFTKYRKK